MKNKILILLFLAYAYAVQANILLPAVFSDNMVLQRNSEVAIWGWSDPAIEVKIVGSWDTENVVKVKANNNSFWTATIKTGEAGGPYTLTISDNSIKVLNNVMLGEVWICSGQSNMEWNVNMGIKNGEDEAAAAHYDNIRFFQLPKVGTENLQENCAAQWEKCTPETMRKTSALAYFFGRELTYEFDVPIGLIVSAWGGTPAEVWTPKDKIEKNAELKRAASVRSDYEWWPKNPGLCYNSMIYPVMPYGIAGAIWYQGESNVQKGQVEAYDLLMRTLINSWREGFKKDFPFYYVQIAPFKYGGADEKANLLREQQVKTLGYPGTGMVVIWDITDDVNNIHPLNKQDVGKRLANMALAKTYKQPGVICESPVYKSMEIEGGKIRIQFDNVPTGLKSSGKNITQFTIAGEDRNFVPADVKIEGKTVVVSCKSVKSPVAVRFMFDNTSIGNLFSNEGLPVTPFRTDDFEY